MRMQDLDLRNYNDDQIEEIEIAVEEGLDVKYLLNENLDCNQMYEISEGMKAGLDVSLYADAKFNDVKMRMIRFALTHELDIKDILDENLSRQEMINRLWIQQFAHQLDIEKPLSEQVKVGYICNFTDARSVAEICLTAEEWIEKFDGRYDVYKVEILDEVKAEYDIYTFDWKEESALRCKKIKVLEKVYEGKRN